MLSSDHFDSKSCGALYQPHTGHVNPNRIVEFDLLPLAAPSSPALLPRSTEREGSQVFDGDLAIRLSHVPRDSATCAAESIISQYDYSLTITIGGG